MTGSHLDILHESLRKKLTVLNKIDIHSKEQEILLKKSPFSFEEFDLIMDEKDSLIDELSSLDNGFDVLYESVREEILANKDSYKNQISQIQELITDVMEHSMTIQVQEARNKSLLESVLLNEKKELRSNKANSTAAYSYYKSMNKGNVVMPQYVDKKK